MKLKSELKILLTVRTDAAVRWKNERASAIRFFATAACKPIPLVLFLRLVSFAYFTLLSPFWFAVRPVLSAYEMRFVRIFSFEQDRAKRNKRKEKLAIW